MKHARAILILAGLLASCDSDPDINGKSVSAWTRTLLTDTSPQRRIEAAQALSRGDPSSRATQVLVMARATDADSSVRQELTRVLQRLPSSATDVVSRVLEDDDNRIRRSAAVAIRDMKDPAKAVVPRLVDRLQDPDDTVTLFALQALARLGMEAYDARDTVRRLAQSSAGVVRAAALAALPEIDSESETFSGLFEDAYRDTSVAVRIAATSNVLAGFRSSHHDPIPFLGRALDDPSPEVVAAALGVLARLRGNAKASLPRIRRLTGAPDANVRAAAVAAVAAIAGR